MDYTQYLQISFITLIFSLAVLILTVAANIPYWSRTDRLWKTEEIESNEKENSK